MDANLNFEKLRQYIHSHEMNLRAGCLKNIPAEIIFRYGGFVGADIQVFNCLDRAMDFCRSLIDQQEGQGRSLMSGTVVLARQLNKSKGRFTRVWHAPQGGLWGCMILVNTFLVETAHLLPLALGVSCCEAIREAGSESSVVRWVNDVLIEGKKVAGFLIEGYQTSLRLEDYNLLGFGVNVNNDAFPEEIGTTAVSLGQAIGRLVDVDRFCLSFLAKLSWNIGLLCYEEQQKLSEGCFSGRNGRHLLVERWEALSDCIGKRVVYGYNVVDKPQYEATVVGVRNDGGLVMQLDDGVEIVEHSGEIRYLRV